jgi:O-antigen/teichoic acid export membrane protein
MASITAHERMSAYAAIGIMDGLLRFGTALLIRNSSSDRLIYYAALMMLTVLLVRLAYGIYCRRNFEECRYRPVFDGSLMKEMFSFAGWNFIGVTAGVLRDHGGNILVNIFSGSVAVNAARGVALQLSNAVQSFVTNFMTAVNPQITKSYAAGEKDYMFSLMRKSSRMAYYLLFIIALPVLFNMETLMELWLAEVPEMSVGFARLFLILALSESLSGPLMTGMLATGKVRNYQIFVGGLIMLNFPVSYLFLKLGYGPEITVIVAIVISQLCLFARLYMLKKTIDFPVRQFVVRVYINILKVTAVAGAVASTLMTVGQGSWVGFVFRVLVCVLCAGLSVFFIGCTGSERREVMQLLSRRERR